MSNILLSFSDLQSLEPERKSLRPQSDQDKDTITIDLGETEEGEFKELSFPKICEQLFTVSQILFVFDFLPYCF